MRIKLFVLAGFVLGVLLLAWTVPAMAQGAINEVSPPVQVTDNTYYERGQSIIYDGSDYWLFYGRSASVTGSYEDDNPDVNDYRVYYKKAAAIPGLVSAAPTLISGVAHNANGYLGETGAAYFGGEVWAFATVISGTSANLYGWYTGDGGTTWTEVGPILTGLSSGQAHHDETVFNGELWVVEGSGNFTTMHSSTPKTGGWSTPLVVDAALTGGLAHFYVEGNSLYLAIFSSNKNYIYKYDDATTSWDKVDEVAPPEKYDPTLFKVGNTYVFAQAPWDGTRQYIVAWSNDTLDGTFFDNGPKMVTEGQYGSNPWVDMWPIGFTTDGGESYLFFTSERNPDDPTAEIDGNIWYLKVDWNLDRDHYTYIQEAVNAALAGDTVSVAAGTYVEQVEITKSLTLTGESMVSTTIQSPDNLTLKFTTSADNYPIVYIHDTEPVTVCNLTVDGAGKGNANYRFVGIAFRNAGGTVDRVHIQDVRDTPFSGAQHGVALYVLNTDGTARNINVYDSLFTGWQKNAMALNAGATTPLTVDVRRNTIVGHGATDITAQNGIQVWAAMGSGTVADNTLSGIAYDNTNSATKWVATTILNYFGDLTITGNTITGAHVGVYNLDGSGLIANNDITIEKVGVFAWGVIATDPPGAIPSPFGVETNDRLHLTANGPLALLTAQVLNNTIVFSGTDNTDTYGIEADAGWGTDDLAFTAKNNYVEGFGAGIELYRCESGCSTGVFTQLTINDNSLVGNTYGLESNVDYLLPDAGGNWWGDSDPSAVASAVSGTVDYTPWLDVGDDTEPATPGFQGDFSTLWVDDDSPQVGPVSRIQEGVNLVSGSTVYVATGVYTEQVVITKSLTLQGQGAGQTFIKAPVPMVADGHGSKNIVTIGGDGVAVEFTGFTVHAPDSTDLNAGIYVQDGADANIHDNVFSALGTNGLTIGIQVGRAAHSVTGTATIISNDIGGYRKGGIVVDNAGSYAEIMSNTITGSGANPVIAENGIQVSRGAAATIAFNTVGDHVCTNVGAGCTDDPITSPTADGAAGILLYASGDGVTVEQNTLTGNQFGIWGVGAERVTIEDNTITGASGTGIAIWDSDQWTEVLGFDQVGTVAYIEGNTLSTHDLGLLVRDYTPGGALPDVTAFDNSITGNSRYAAWGDALVNAGGNWWGESDPSAVAAVISGTVDYTPWLDVGDDTEPATPGFQGDFSTLWVDDDSPQVGTVGRIQEGVNLVSGDTLYAAAGTYVEQVEITKTLTIIGAGMFSTTIQSPDLLPLKFTSTADNHPIVYIHDTDSVTLRRLMVDGAGKGNANYRFVGIAFYNADGATESVGVKGMHDTPLSDAEHGVGLYVYGDDDSPHTVLVRDGLFTDWQKSALAFRATDTTPLTVEVLGNTITGWGATTVIPQNGIEVWAAQGRATIANNTLTDIAYDNTSAPVKEVASSILNYYTTITVTGNTIGSAQMGVYNYDGEGRIEGNDLTVEKVGVAAWGILATDPPGVQPAPFDGESHPLRPDMGNAGPVTLTVEVLSNTVTFSGTDNAATYGIEADAGWGADNLDFTANHNIVEGFEAGIELYQCRLRCSSGLFTKLTARWNCFAGNTYGMRSNVSYLIADGRENYWGDPSGPYHPTLRPSGQGDAVSDYVEFRPWTDSCGGRVAVFHLFLPIVTKGW